MAKLLYQGQNLSRAPKEKSAWTSPTTVLTGDTTVTIYDSRIKSTSIIKKYVEPYTTGEVLGASNIQITDGQAVITFDSPAKEDTTIKLEIIDGEGFKEVTLWENSSPTSSMSGATQVTLSDNLSNYNYVKITWRYNTSNATECTTIIPYTELKTFFTATVGGLVGIGQTTSGGVHYLRPLYYISDTVIQFGSCNQQSGATSDNSISIPLKITGLTELNQVKIRNAKVENVLWTNSAPTSAYASGTATLSDNIDNYDYIKFVYKPWYTGNTVQISSVYSVSDVKQSISGSATNHNLVSMICNLTDGSTFARRVFYSSDTVIGFNNSYQINASNSSNNTNIPLQIIGIKEVSTHKADIYGAAQDTIYYSTNGTDWTVVGQTDSNGYLANAVLPDTAFILKSSVAKNPEDLTADYTKVFNTDSNVLRFMPDNCLYWYGYMSPNAEETSPANGWTLYSGYSFVAPTYSTNKFNLTTIASTSGNTQSGIGSKNKTHNASRLYAITQGKTIAGTRYGELMDNSVKELVNDVEITTNIIAKSQADITGDSYVAVMTNAARSIDVYALWYE